MYEVGTVVKLLSCRENFSGKWYIVQDNLNISTKDGKYRNIVSSHPIILIDDNGNKDMFKYIEIISLSEYRSIKLNKIL